jgi:putative radical SAM enzyme (TIGR03279 family)
LAAAGITLHTQAVICPGINDGPILEKTICDLADLWPQVASLAIVPVGLTGHRQRLFNLRVPNRDEADKVLKMAAEYQKKFLKKINTRFVFAADEWYIIAREAFPSDEAYEGYPQLDNGVGLIRWFLTEFNENLPKVAPALQKVEGELVIVTGLSTIRLWDEIKLKFGRDFPKLKLTVLPVPNHFFGLSVTVTGLLSGRDIIDAIITRPQSEGEIYLVPEITLKPGEAVFLDGISVNDLIEACRPKKVAITPTRASAWLDWIISQITKLEWE